MLTSVVAIVGRTNVGKSTLFNRLTNSRDALVHDRAGLTRDRQYGVLVTDRGRITLIDTGGLLDDSSLGHAITEQVEFARDEADLVLLLVDARTGLIPADELVATVLRRSTKPVRVVVNKVDGLSGQSRLEFAEFTALGFGTPLEVSAAHGHGLDELSETLSESLRESAVTASEPEPNVRVAIVGRPNVGKSTIVNALVGAPRSIVADQPGTTRDTVRVPVEIQKRRYTFFDTAGIRRKGRVTDVVEKFSVIKALDAMNQAEVAVLLLDASEGLVDQDQHIIRYAADAGCGLILAVNKWDLLDQEQRRAARASLRTKLSFARWLPIRYVSAAHGAGLSALKKMIHRVYDTGRFDAPTARITHALEAAVQANPPPSVRGRQVKLKYAHKVAGHPPTILVHGTQTDALPDSYVRFLENTFRREFDLMGVPVRVRFRTTVNPYESRRNELSQRQRKRRERLIRHRKSR